MLAPRARFFSRPRRKRITAVSSVAVALLALACAHAPEPEPARAPDPSPSLDDDEERQRAMACLTLGEALYGATATRQVIAEAAGSPRMAADEESLAPLVDCLQRASAAKDAPWPEPVVRSLANGYAAALLGSRLPRENVIARLTQLKHDGAVRADVVDLWGARLPGTPLDEQEAALRRALGQNPDNPAATLALALVLLEGGRSAEAESLSAAIPAEVRPDLRAVIASTALLERGDRHQASALLEKLAKGELADTAPDGPDALALRLLRAPPVAPLLCAAGRAHKAAGERADALRVYGAGACFADVTELHLDEGDSFAALLTSFHAPDEVRERAFEAASAYGLLEEQLAAAVGTCDRLGGGERCAAHRAKLERARGGDTRTSGRQPPVSAEHDEILRRALGVLFLGDDEALLRARPLEGDAEVLYLVRGSVSRLRDRPETGVVERTLLSPGTIPSTGIEPDYSAGLQIEVLDVVHDRRGGRTLVHALQVGVDDSPSGASPLRARRGGLALVEKTAQGWRAVRFPRPMALSPGGP